MPILTSEAIPSLCKRRLKHSLRSPFVIPKIFARVRLGKPMQHSGVHAVEKVRRMPREWLHQMSLALRTVVLSGSSYITRSRVFETLLHHSISCFCTCLNCCSLFARLTWFVWLVGRLKVSNSVGWLVGWAKACPVNVEHQRHHAHSRFPNTQTNVNQHAHADTERPQEM